MENKLKTAGGQTPQIRYLNALRLFATISVVMIHATATWFNNNQYSPSNYLSLGFYRGIFNYAVPIFVLISGSLFFLPNKKIDYSVLFRKYVRRVVLALIVFGLPMCMMEVVFTHDSLVKGVVNWLTGHSWDHMWYLYMLIGLYLLTPILKPFVTNASKQTFEIALLILFMMSSILPTINKLVTPIHSWMTLSSYIFLYMLGYYLAFIESGRLKKGHLIFIILLCTLIEFCNVLFEVKFFTYYNPNILVLTAALFLLAKRMDLSSHLADKLNPYCFGIYLIHPIFYNIMHKVLKFNPYDYVNAWVGVIALGFVVFVLSFCCCYVLRKIPFLSKHVL